jgi:hypothetical protein
MKTLSCERCGQRVFFENVACENCGAALGFVPDEMRMASFDIGDDGSWQRTGNADRGLQPCLNYSEHQVCNWMVPTGSANPLCLSCATTFIVPALSKPENLAYWQLIEQAKRRLFYSLLSLKLPVPSKAEDAEHGLSFQFLEQLPAQRGDDRARQRRDHAQHRRGRRRAARAGARASARAVPHAARPLPPRDRPLLLGPAHRRLGMARRIPHAVRRRTRRLRPGLAAHYASPAADWPQNFVSSYASSHPWEDWAECWAHYMHLQDGLETAAAWGLKLNRALPGAPPVEAKAMDLASRQSSPR